MRKLHISILSLCICLFSTSAFAEEIRMTCTIYNAGKTLTRHFKYSDPMFGKRDIYQRVDGTWKNWCIPRTKDYKPCELTITERGAIQKSYDLLEIGPRDSKKYNIAVGTPVIQNISVWLDFEFATNKHQLENVLMNGTNVTTFVYNWNCKIKD